MLSIVYDWAVLCGCQKKYGQDYMSFLKDRFSHISFQNNIKVVLDCSNGASSFLASQVFSDLGFEVTAIGNTPDGKNINANCGSLYPQNLARKVVESKADMGVAYDGDADRIAVLSQKYNFKGDILAIFFSKFMKDPIVVGEVKCSQVMYDEINKIGQAHMYKTGHSNLKVKIKELNASFAAEVSGHIFFADKYFGYDDAIYSTLRALELLNDGFDFDAEFEKLPQVYSTEEITINTTEEKKFGKRLLEPGKA